MPIQFYEPRISFNMQTGVTQHIFGGNLKLRQPTEIGLWIANALICQDCCEKKRYFRVLLHISEFLV